MTRMFAIVCVAFLALCQTNVGRAAEPTFEATIDGFDLRTQCGSFKGSTFTVKASGTGTTLFAQGQHLLHLQRNASELATAQAATACPPPVIVRQCAPTSCYGLTTSSRSSCYGTTTRSCCGTRTTSSCCGSRTASTTSCAGYTPTYLRYQAPPLGRAFWCNCPDHIRACAALGRTDWQGIPCQCRPGCSQCAMHPH